MDDEGVATIRLLEKRFGVYKSQNGDGLVDKKKNRKSDNIHTLYVLNVYSSYVVVVIIYNNQ